MKLIDPRVAKLLVALRADPELARCVDAFDESRKRATGRKFGSNGLKVNDKLFALFTQGTFVVKLPKDRVAELIAARVGKSFDPGHGRLMKEWLTVTSAKASWLALAREAHAFVSGAPKRHPPTSPSRKKPKVTPLEASIDAWFDVVAEATAATTEAATKKALARARALEHLPVDLLCPGDATGQILVLAAHDRFAARLDERIGALPARSPIARALRQMRKLVAPEA